VERPIPALPTRPRPGIRVAAHALVATGRRRADPRRIADRADSVSSRACSSAWENLTTVSGRKAFLTSGRLIVIFAIRGWGGWALIQARRTSHSGYPCNYPAAIHVVVKVSALPVWACGSWEVPTIHSEG